MCKHLSSFCAPVSPPPTKPQPPQPAHSPIPQVQLGVSGVFSRCTAAHTRVRASSAARCTVCPLFLPPCTSSFRLLCALWALSPRPAHHSAQSTRLCFHYCKQMHLYLQKECPALVCTICSPRPLAGAAEPQVDRVCVRVRVCVCARVRTRRKVVLAKAAPPGLRSAHLDEVHTQRSRAHLGCVCHQRRPLCVRSLMCARRSVQQQRGGCSGLSAVQSPPRLVSILVYNIHRPTPFAAHRLRGRALLALCARCLMPQNM